MSDLLNGPVIAGPRFPSYGDSAELEDTPGSRIPTEWLHETDGGRLLVRRQARLFVAARLLASVPGVLSDLVRRMGTAVEVRPTNHARQCCRAAVLLADELIGLNDRLPCPTPPTEAVMANGGPHTADAVRLFDVEDAA